MPTESPAPFRRMAARGVRSSLLIDVIALSILSVAGLRLTSGMDRVLDLMFFDESFYLRWSLESSIVEQDPEWAPLYLLWYRLLSVFESDRVALYFLNYRLTTFLSVPVVYCYLRRLRISAPAALIVAYLILVSHVNVYAWPRVCHFALLILLSHLTATTFFTSVTAKFAIVAVGATLAAYARPEYFLAAVTAYGCLGAIVFRRGLTNAKSQLPWLIAVVAISTTLVAVWGVPFGGERSMWAFGQHFSVNWIGWTGSDLSPWMDYRQIFAQNFGDADSLGEVATANPSAFFHHIGSNVEALVKSPLWAVFPVTMSRAGKICAAIVVVALGVALRRNCSGNIRAVKFDLVLLALLILPGLISVVVIHPRAHYLLVPFVLATIGVVVIVAPRHEAARRMTLACVLGLGTLLIAVTPTAYDLPHTGQPNLMTLRKLQSLELSGTQPVAVLELDGGYDIYLGPRFRRVAAEEKDVGFRMLLTRDDVGVVVVSDELRNDSRLRDDAEWKTFIADPAAAGFVAVDVPGTERRVLV